MRHAIIVVGCQEQLSQSSPELVLRDNESVRYLTWYAGTDQQNPSRLLDDQGSVFRRLLLAPLLAYRFYLHVHSAKLWSGKRPLVFVRDRSLSGWVAAYAGRWGGGDVVMPSRSGEALLGPTRFLLRPDGSLELRVD